MPQESPPECPRCGAIEAHDRQACDRTIEQARVDHEMGRHDEAMNRR